MPQHFLVSINAQTGKAEGDGFPIGANDEADVGSRGDFDCRHLVLARDARLAAIAAETDHADESEPCPVYPTRKAAYEVLE